MITFWITCLFILSEIFIASFFMEIYKKVIRKDKYSIWECRLIALFISIICTGIIYLSNISICFLNKYLSAKIWLDYISYLIIFYILQLKTDMLFIKKLFKSTIKVMLKKYGFTEEQIKELEDNLKK